MDLTDGVFLQFVCSSHQQALDVTVQRFTVASKHEAATLKQNPPFPSSQCLLPLIFTV